MKRKSQLDLFLTFLRIGLFTFGGGYAMISVIEHICVDQKKWITHEDMMHITVIAESTPGPLAINCATFVGFRLAGSSGAAAATVGLVVPSFTIIFLISLFLDTFLEMALIASAFRGIKIAVGLLILNAALTMLKKAKKTPLFMLILICSAAATLLVNLFSWNLSTITLMLIAGGVSLVLFLVQKKGGAE